jgi:hypothetical protein
MPSASEMWMAHGKVSRMVEERLATYRLTGTDMKNKGTFYHWLEDMDLSESTCLHGPVTIQTSGTNTAR